MRELERERKKERERMFQPKKPTTMSSHERSFCVQGDSSLVLTTDPKPRLRWTVELHDRFVDAVTQLGGPDKATPKTIMRVMGVRGLTLYHLKSHLQKFRLGKQPHKEFNDHSVKDAAAVDMQRNAPSSSMMGRRMMNDRNVHVNEGSRMQMEVQRRLHEQLEVQKHLQMKIEAQGKYMQSMLEKAMLEKASQTVAGENISTISANYSGFGNQSATDHNITLPSLQDLYIYSGDHQLSLEIDKSPLEGFLNDLENFPSENFYSCSNGKSPMIWADDLRLQELGFPSAAYITPDEPPKISTDQLEIAPLRLDSGVDMDPMAEIYDTKPVLSTDSS